MTRGAAFLAGLGLTLGSCASAPTETNTQEGWQPIASPVIGYECWLFHHEGSGYDDYTGVQCFPEGTPRAIRVPTPLTPPQE